MLGIDPKTLTRYARARNVHPLSRVRVGRSTVTRWAIEDVARMAPEPG